MQKIAWSPFSASGKQTTRLLQTPSPFARRLGRFELRDTAPPSLRPRLAPPPPPPPPPPAIVSCTLGWCEDLSAWPVGARLHLWVVVCSSFTGRQREAGGPGERLATCRAVCQTVLLSSPQYLAVETFVKTTLPVGSTDIACAPPRQSWVWWKTTGADSWIACGRKDQ